MKPLCRAALAAALLLAAGPAVAPAQDPRVEPPRTPAEFWSAVEFELNTGQYESAAFYLRGLLAANPTDQDFIAIERDRGGMATFLRLRTVPQWSADAKVNAEDRQLAEQVIERATAALKKTLGDPQRIARFIQNLSATPEERAYAVTELQRSGAQAMPQLVATLQAERDPERRAIILGVLPRLFADTVQPLLAATDMQDPVTKVQLLTALGARNDLAILPHRAETDPLPTLDHLAASPKESQSVRREATQLQSRIRAVAPSRMPPAKAELTRAAERFYRHQAAFINPAAVPVWRWENDRLVSYTGTASQAEEYFGLRYARWALELDPAYEPAQVVFLSIATEKAMERGGLEQPLARTAPDVHDLLATVYAGALINTLDRALVEKRTAVALGIVRALGERAEIQAARPERNRPGVLVRALDYADRRVQLAAADALLRLPGPPVHQAMARVIEVLRRAVAVDAETTLPARLRILVAHFQPALAEQMAQAVRAAGDEAVVVHTGREVMRRLNEAADIDAIILDADLPYPPLPDTIASLRYDVHAGLLPVRIVYLPVMPGTVTYVSETNRPVSVNLPAQATESINTRTEARLNRLIESYRQIAVVRGPLTPALVQREFAPPEGPPPAENLSPPLTPAERKAESLLAMEWLSRLATCPVPGYDVRPAERTIRLAMQVPELARLAIEATSRLPGRDPQTDLANYVLNPQNPIELRILAADNLIFHVQRNGPALSMQQMQALMDLLPTLQDPVLRARVGSAIGSVQGNSRQAGQRMERYTPPLPTPTPPPGAPATPPAAPAQPPSAAPKDQ
jgi:hypothetical protein